jgi:3-hydroxypropionyl-CoA synthetase (ADP-forming)
MMPNILDYGFRVPKFGIAATSQEAVDLANSIGYPVVMKIESPDILHKTDVGGVVLGLRSAAEVEANFTAILENVHKNNPAATASKVRVEEMCSGGIEIIIGLNRDPQYGLVIMFGLGGVFTEVLNDTSFRSLPITRSDAFSMIQEIRGYPILKGYRGMQPVSIEMLIDLLMKTSQFGIDFADQLESVDLNPITVWGNDYRVLDVKLIMVKEKLIGSESSPNVDHIDTFFNSCSVALVGASSTPGKVGNSVLDSLINHDYRGRVFSVNPVHKEIMGVQAYPSLSSIPEEVDLVVVAVPLVNVPGLLYECQEKGIHNMVILSGGGKELGMDDSSQLEAKIKHLAEELGVRIIGCNCVGVFDGESRLDTFFQTHERMVRPKLGSISMFTQSGTVGVSFLEELERVGVSRFVSYGNRIDVDEADIITFLANDDQTSVIVGYIEGIEKGKKFLEAAKQAAVKKPIVVYKSGRTQRAATASMSHTGFFGGSYSVSRGVFKQAGLIVVDSFQELVAASKALAMQPKAHGPKISMISNGAGTMVQAMDLLEVMGLEMAPLAEHLVHRLKEVYPSNYIIQNPLDVTGSATSQDYKVGIEALLEDPNVDIVMPWFVFQDTPLDEGIIYALKELNQARRKPILCGAFGGAYTQKISRSIEEIGVPVYQSVRDWIIAARCLSS